MTRLVVLAVALGALISLTACSNPNGPPGNYGQISGTITNSSGQPVAGVIVVVDYAVQSQPSAANGTYTVSYVPVTDPLSPDVVSILPSSVPAGYGVPQPQTNVMVQAGQTTWNVNFTLPRS